MIVDDGILFIDFDTESIIKWAFCLFESVFVFWRLILPHRDSNSEKVKESRERKRERKKKKKKKREGQIG